MEQETQGQHLNLFEAKNMNATTTATAKSAKSVKSVKLPPAQDVPAAPASVAPAAGFLTGKSMSVDGEYLLGNTGAILAQVPLSNLYDLPLDLQIPVTVAGTDIITGARVESVVVDATISLATLLHFGLLGLTERIYTNKLETKDPAVKADKAKGIAASGAIPYTLQESTMLKFQAWQHGYQTYAGYDAATRETPEQKAVRLAAELLAAKVVEIDRIKTIAVGLDGISDAQREWVRDTPSADLVDLITRVIDSPKWPGLKERVAELGLTHYAPIESNGDLF